MEVTKDRLREVLFGNYSNLIAFAKSKFNAESKGIPCEELVNEAIISVLDIKIIKEEEIIPFVKKSIENIFYHEKSLLKNINFSIKVSNDGEEFNLSEISRAPILIDAPSEEFVKMYAIFERARFGRSDEKKVCPRCGSTQFNIINANAPHQCKVCRKRLSVTSGTYISSRKLSFAQIYKLITIISKDRKCSTLKLAKRVKVTQKTAWHRKHLIVSVMQNIQDDRRAKTLYKILTDKTLDAVPVELIDTNPYNRKLSTEDVMNIRRLVRDKVYTRKELSEMYLLDRRGIDRLIIGESYAHLPVYYIPKIKYQKEIAA